MTMTGEYMKKENEHGYSRIDHEEFVEWCERQMPRSVSPTTRFIVKNDAKVKFRIREERDAVHDIVLIKGDEADTIRFESSGRGVEGRDTERRQFHTHKRNIRFAEFTLIVETEDGREICRAGTTSAKRLGAFPDMR
jgi:hypothetical protein